jgi:hypothetical protein
MTAHVNQRIWFSTEQAADYAGCDPQTVAKACRAGTLKAGQPFGGKGRRPWLAHPRRNRPRRVAPRRHRVS